MGASRPGFSFMTDYVFDVMSTTTWKEFHTISIDVNPPRVSCTCIGYRTHFHCKHIKFYKKLIESLMHEKQGV